MIVADASLLAHLLIPGLDREIAEGVFQSDPIWRVPGLWPYELRNILLKYIRVGSLTAEAAAGVLTGAEATFGPVEQDAPSEAVIAAAVAFGITSYDAEYLALARMLSVPLITFDKKLVRASRGLALSPADFVR